MAKSNENIIDRLSKPMHYMMHGQIPVVEKEQYDELLKYAKYLLIVIDHEDEFNELVVLGATWNITDDMNYYSKLFERWKLEAYQPYLSIKV